MTNEEKKRIDDWCKVNLDPIWNEPYSRSNAIRMAVEEFLEHHP
jgi:hypothetical protein